MKKTTKATIGNISLLLLGLCVGFASTLYGAQKNDTPVEIKKESNVTPKQKIQLSPEDYNLLTKTIINQVKPFLMPVGSIIMWSGKIKDIPKGWVLCDGSDNTPDLRDKFIVGSGNKYQSGDTGGQAQHKHKVEVKPHTLSINEMPSHDHTYDHHAFAASSGRTNIIVPQYAVMEYNGSTSETHSKGGNAPHTHGASCTVQSNLPPYYALCFIMLKNLPKLTL